MLESVNASGFTEGQDVTKVFLGYGGQYIPKKVRIIYTKPP